MSDKNNTDNEFEVSEIVKDTPSTIVIKAVKKTTSLLVLCGAVFVAGFMFSTSDKSNAIKAKAPGLFTTKEETPCDIQYNDIKSKQKQYNAASNDGFIFSNSGNVRARASALNNAIVFAKNLCGDDERIAQFNTVDIVSDD